MQREEFLRLISAEGQALLESIRYDSKADVVGLVSSLRKQGHDPLTIAAVLTQAKLRKRAESKFGEFARSMLFSEAGLEQASRLKVAALHADRFRKAGIQQVADLGCGIGSEAMAMAAIGIEVRAFEIDEVTAAIATFNLAPLENVEVELADVTKIDLNQFQALFFDPARRDVGKSKRVFDPKSFSPPFDFCVSEAIKKPSGIKLGPGLNKSEIPNQAEAQWVSVNGDLVELGLWFNSAKRPNVARSALLISGSEHFEITSENRDSDSAKLSDLKEYVYEPDNSLIRSGLISEFADPLELSLISPDIAYLSSSEIVSSPWIKGYRVLDNLAFDRKKLKAYLRERNIGILEIKKRGADISPEQLRRELSPKGEGAATLIITRVGDAHRVLVTQPISD